MRLSGYTYRWPVVVYSASDTTSDVTVTPPVAWDAFWTTVLSSGYDVCFTSADGVTPLTFKRTTWTYATKSATLELDAVVLKTGANIVYMYWGKAGASDSATTPTITSPVPSSIYLGQPNGNVVAVLPPRATQTVSDGVVVKTSAEATRIWWDFSSRLESAHDPIADSNLYEEVKLVSAQLVLNASEETQSSMVDLSLSVALDGLVGTWVKAGSAGDYMAVVRVTTSLDRVLEGRVQLTVLDLEV